MGWRGAKEKADVHTIKEKIREFTKYHKKKVRGVEKAKETSSSIPPQENRNKCSSCSEEGDLIQHLVTSSQCRRAYVKNFLAEEEVDVEDIKAALSQTNIDSHYD